MVNAKAVRRLRWAPPIVSLAYVVLATVLRYGLNGVLGARGPWIFFFPAVVLASWQFGWSAGLLALGASVVAGTYFFLPPTFSLLLKTSTDAWVVLSFVLSGGVIVYFGSKSRDDRRRLEEEGQRREAAQRESAQSLRTLRSVFDNTHGDALILVDPDRRVLTWNVGAREMFGYTEAEMRGKPIDLLYVPEEREAGAPAAKAALASEEGHAESERWYQRQDGTRFWGEGRLSALRDENGGEVKGFVKVLRDETRRRQLDEALRGQNEELERRVLERTAELEGFTYSVSHDMRAPLRAIAGNASILVEDYKDVVPPDAAALLVRVRAAANKMGALIEDLLTYARLGNQAPRSTRTDLVPIFREVAEEERGEADVRFESPEHLFAECDPGLVRMVLQNLVGNAIKYRRRDGTARVEFGQDERGAFYVKDDGIGFDMQYAPKLFVPFERLHRDTEYPGTGIGLANVKRIVERHGGQVGARGELGCGSTFWFTLPTPRS